MEQVLVNFRMDKADKIAMEKTCKVLGLSLSTAFNIFAKKVAREQRIPFSVEVDPFYSDENMERLRIAAKRMEETGGTIHDIDEAIKYAESLG